MFYGVWCHSTLPTNIQYASGNVGLVGVQELTVTTTQLHECNTNRPRQGNFYTTVQLEMACLRTIEGVTKWDKIRNTEIRSRLGCAYDIIHRIQQRRLR